VTDNLEIRTRTILGHAAIAPDATESCTLQSQNGVLLEALRPQPWTQATSPPRQSPGISPPISTAKGAFVTLVRH
jgi:hypothetical protein